MNDRAQRLIALLEEAQIDLLLVTDLVNVRYLSGYTGSNGIVLVGADTREFITDFRYRAQAAEEVHPSFACREAPLDLLEAVGDALPPGRLRLGFEETHMSVRDHARLSRLFDGRATLTGVSGLVERLRAVKEPGEVERIRAAAALADAAFERLLRDGLIGRTEREVARALEHDMRERGARRASFDTIVAAGAHAAQPHAQPSDQEIREGELVVIDWGAELDGYCSDCTRTVAAGEPSAQARSIYELVLEAQSTGVQAVRSGIAGRDADSAARAIIDEAGQGENFGHGLGHGVGIEVHEAPRLSQRSQDELVSGNVVTVEPGVYLPGRLGVRIEDLVVIANGRCDVLTSVPKQLVISD